MNYYQISYTAYPVTKDGEINQFNHYSGCRRMIEGVTYEEAVDNFKKDQKEKGYFVDFICEGDIAKVTIIEKETT